MLPPGKYDEPQSHITVLVASDLLVQRGTGYTGLKSPPLVSTPIPPTAIEDTNIPHCVVVNQGVPGLDELVVKPPAAKALPADLLFA